MNAYRDCRVQNKGIQIHYIAKGNPSPDHYSIIGSPGIWEPAERFIPIFDTLNRHCISLSYRGRGKSDTPLTGYDLEDHISDLEAVVENEHLDKFCILAFSRGVPYAIGYYLKHPGKVSGLILVDQPARQNKWSEGEAEFWKNLIYLGKPLTNFIRPEALDRIEKEARFKEFWDDLPKIECPVLLLRGLDKTHAIPPDLSDEDSKKFKLLLKNVREVGFEHSGHMIPDNEPEKYSKTVRDFLDELDCKKKSI